MSAAAPARDRLIVWRGLDAFRAEAADVRLLADRLSARGVQIGAEPLPYRLDYELDTGEGFVTTRLAVQARGQGWTRSLDLRRDGDGSWSCSTQSAGAPELGEPGGELSGVAGALDCDLGLCPLTNTMPVRRCGLLEGGEGQDFVMAWVSVPGLQVHRSEQRYEHVRRTDQTSVVRYVGRHRDFVGELELDADGLVIHYPQLAERVGAG